MPHPLLRAHPLLVPLAADLQAHPGQPAPDDGNPARAAVAIVLRASRWTAGHREERSDVAPSGWEQGSARTVSTVDTPLSALPSPFSHLEVLLIQRAERAGDPWSGQVALPGGRRDASDATLQDTAIRETREETGVDLAVHGYVLGALDELRPRTPVLPPIIVTPFVAVVAADRPLGGSDEVAEAFWVPWSFFADPASVEESTVHVRGAAWRVNSYRVGHRVVWGMTERILRQLAERLTRL